MKLPNAELAEVPESKLVRYLLSLEHEDGRGKAQFFDEIGFRAENWGDLASALRVHALAHDVVLTQETEFGMKYIVDGEIDSPIGRRPNIRVVWFVERGEQMPRLVTAHPLARKSGME